MSAFEKLNSINVNGHTEKKNGLTYLSWAWAWGELLKAYPDSTYTIYENKDGWNYHTDGKTAWVKTGVTVEGKEYVEMLPVMDFKNRSIPLEQITSFDVNKAIQRSLTKAVARHGLGLYIYAGEDLPETDAASGMTPAASAPLISAEEIEKLKQNARYVYGDEYALKLVELMAQYGFNTPDQITTTAYELIKSQMTKDLKKKKGAA